MGKARELGREEQFLSVVNYFVLNNNTVSNRPTG